MKGANGAEGADGGEGGMAPRGSSLCDRKDYAGRKGSTAR